MRISWIKAKSDTKSFNLPKNLGMNVLELENLESTDEAIHNLINNEYKTIILSNEVAGFSQDIIKKYAYNTDINIMIAPSKR